MDIVKLPVEIIGQSALKLVLPNDLAGNITKAVSKSHVISSGHKETELAVNWDYDEASTLAFYTDATRPQIVADIPSPILRDFNWPGTFKPFAHQFDTASFLSIRHRAFCFNEAGTGKTSAAIWAADYLMNMGVVRRVLVICPISIMISAWQADIFHTAMHRSVGIAYGSADKRRAIIKKPYDFVIINYDGIGIVQDDLAKAGFDLIIVDEANAYKTPTTRRWKALNRIISSKTRIWMMTGTPAAQSPVDAFGLAKFVAPYRVPKYLSHWRSQVLDQISRFKWVPKRTALNDVYHALQPAIRYAKRECLDLPDITYQTRNIPLTLQVQRYYHQLKNALLMEVAGQEISAVNAASALSKLLQLSGGAVYTDGGDYVEFDVSPRLKELRAVLDETTQKVVVFVPYRHTIELVTEFLQREGFKVGVIHGDVSLGQRSALIKAFQTEAEPRIMVLQPRTASHGITLTEADTLVFWSPVLSVDTYIQCIGRIDRIGQKNKTTVVHIQGSPAERHVYTMLKNKLDSHEQLVELYKEVMGDDDV